MLCHYRFEDDCYCQVLDAGTLVKGERTAQDRVNDEGMCKQCTHA